MSDYEYKAMTDLISLIRKEFGEGIDREDCEGECVEAYCEIRNIMSKNRDDFWNIVAEHMSNRVIEYRHKRNQKITLESKLSLNSCYGDSDEEIGSIMFPSKDDFVGHLMFWNDCLHMGDKKYSIMKLLSCGEDKNYIMEQLGIAEGEYKCLINEIREELKNYFK